MGEQRREESAKITTGCFHVSHSGTPPPKGILLTKDKPTCAFGGRKKLWQSKSVNHEKSISQNRGLVLVWFICKPKGNQRGAGGLSNMLAVFQTFRTFMIGKRVKNLDIRTSTMRNPPKKTDL